MKSILISDHAKWCALMMNGQKKIEVRKANVGKAVQKLIDEYGFAEFYVYCTKGKPNLWLPYEYDCFELDEASQPYLSDEPIIDIDTKMNGKVIFKFRCYKVEEILYDHDDIEEWYATKTLDDKELEKQSCLTYEELDDYLYDGKSYAIHISDLEIFDEPKPLWHFHRAGGSTLYQKTCKKALEGRCNVYPCQKAEITKAPESFYYVEVE